MYRLLSVIWYKEVDYVKMLHTGLRQYFTLDFYPLFQHKHDVHDKKKDFLNHFADYIVQSSPNVILFVCFELDLEELIAIRKRFPNIYFAHYERRYLCDRVEKYSNVDIVLNHHQSPYGITIPPGPVLFYDQEEVVVPQIVCYADSPHDIFREIEMSNLPFKLYGPQSLAVYERIYQDGGDNLAKLYRSAKWSLALDIYSYADIVACGGNPMIMYDIAEQKSNCLVRTVADMETIYNSSIDNRRHHGTNNWENIAVIIKDAFYREKGSDDVMALIGVPVKPTIPRNFCAKRYDTLNRIGLYSSDKDDETNRIILYWHWLSVGYYNNYQYPKDSDREVPRLEGYYPDIWRVMGSFPSLDLYQQLMLLDKTAKLCPKLNINEVVAMYVDER